VDAACLLPAYLDPPALTRSLIRQQFTLMRAVYHYRDLGLAYAVLTMIARFICRFPWNQIALDHYNLLPFIVLA
jgi:hypothetical protein